MRVTTYLLVTACLMNGIVADTACAQSLSSYAIAATDTAGSSTGSSSVALGMPDYEFVNDATLGFGGSNTDVFGPNESAVFQFPNPLKNIPGQPDMKVSAFVGGLGATDNATVQVEASSDGANFQVIATFDTADGRVTYAPRGWTTYSFERDFESVKHFEVEFGAMDDVTHIRLTNLAGTSEGLRLDSLEGFHPYVLSDHAFEIRYERYRGSNVERFLVRIKNLARPGGVGIREIRINKPVGPLTHLESTYRSFFDHSGSNPIVGIGSRFLCVENCIPDNGPLIPFSRHAWSLDGITEAPAGIGLDPGRQASHRRDMNFDLDTPNQTFLSGFSFKITFTDNTTHSWTFDGDVIPLNEEGMEWQKYQYFDSTPAIALPHRVHYYQFTDVGQVAAKTSYGTGCLGLGHDADARPRTGTTIQLTTDSMPAGTGFGVTVLSLTQINPGTNLTSLGLTGCFLYVNVDIVESWVPVAGIGQSPFPIPNNTSLAGIQFMTQGAVFASGINPAGMLSSNGLLLTVGNF